MNPLNKIYLLAAVFIVVAPLSIAGTATQEIKIVRLAITATMAGMGLFVYRSDSFRGMTKGFTAFAILFTISSLWSDDIRWALFNKGMFLLAVLGGIYMATTTRNKDELSKGIRVLAFTGTLAGFLLFLAYLINPDANTSGDRLAVAGMNANTIGSSAAPMFILSFFLGLSHQGFKTRLFCFGSATLLAIIILGTGSRGATLMALVGTLIATKPFLQKRAFSIILSVAIPLGILQVVSLSMGTSLANKIPGLSRATNFSSLKGHNNRAGMWKYAIKQWNTNRLIGIGWLHFNKSKATANCHNLYLQILAETGILGAVIMTGVLIQILLRTQVVKHELFGTATPELLALPMGLLASIAVHGMVEASALFGTTCLPLLLGYSIGLIDRLPVLTTKATDGSRAVKRAPAIPQLDIRSRQGHQNLADSL